MNKIRLTDSEKVELKLECTKIAVKCYEGVSTRQILDASEEFYEFIIKNDEL